MIRFVPLAFAVSILFAGCTAPAHLTHTSELSQDEKMQQTIDTWKGTHISKAAQKWGAPTETTDDGTGWQIYVWHLPVWRFLGGPEPLMKPRPGQHPALRQHPSGLYGVRGTYLSTDYTYKITFYTRPNGTIHKTRAERNQNPASEFKWK